MGRITKEEIEAVERKKIEHEKRCKEIKKQAKKSCLTLEMMLKSRGVEQCEKQ